jgi:hypothetical protein
MMQPTTAATQKVSAALNCREMVEGFLADELVARAW